MAPRLQAPIPEVHRDLVGPEADHEMLGNALRFCGGYDATHPGAHGFTGKATTPEHYCEIDAEAYGFCAIASPCGGVAICLVCGIPIFVPPETCTERIDAAPAAEIVVDAASGDRLIF